QFVRDSYMNLNGEWDYSFSKTEDIEKEFDGKILVPFSPESVLSGVKKTLLPTDFLHYEKEFEISSEFFKGRVLLHFGAVDQIAKAFINGKFVGSHTGGFNSFTFDITNAIVVGKNKLHVVVTDSTDTSFQTRAKQSSKRGAIWYTPQSGIWQTVWLESVPNDYVESIKITPSLKDKTVEIKANVVGQIDKLNYEISFKGKIQATGEFENNVAIVKLDEVFPWNTTEPNLYDLKIFGGLDEVASYFAMRDFGIEKDENGFSRLTLNGEKIFHNGLLDQGYYSDGLLTPPSDEALIDDVTLAKSLGFNMLRKHIKVEPLRFYYHCDRLGMIVWQDAPSGGEKYHSMVTQVLPFIGIKIKDNHYSAFGRKSEEGRNQYYFELDEMLNSLYNCPSIATWVPFNEGWGQFDSKVAYEKIKAFDKTRYIDHASGWHDQKVGDFNSLHVYYKKIKFKNDDRVLAVTEFGGYSRYIKEHAFNQGKVFGYKVFETEKELENAYRKLFDEEIIANIPKGLSACIYTQLTDVEDEVNGLITYDREKLKFSADFLREINAKVKL
ncbi:MAG: glycoside hydrolase family 2 TIM barrel-domain containing protein, partial [Clostridia bacterium]